MGFPAVKALVSRLSRKGSPIEGLGLLPEPMFLRALSLERRRAERSKKRFILMVVSSAPGAQNDDGAILARSVDAILAAIRDTDVAGWYQDQAALGVIFTEMGSGESKAIVGALRAKVTAALGANLDAAELASVHITLHSFPEDLGNVEGWPSIEKLYPDLEQRNESRKAPRAVKRAIDILGSATVLLLLSPVLLLIALAIKLTSPGPILFRQKRVGQYGVPFTCLKFRSMLTGNDPRIHMEFVKQFIAGGSGHCAVDLNGAASNDKVYKITKDPRLTRVGQFLRKTSLDELPQFWNVLRGDMSMVGPRPPISYELQAYDIWHRRRLLEMKPGITGLWQVNGRSRLAFDDMVRLDLRYAKTWSLWLDLKILLQTPRVVLSGDGAY
jgi:exopolysaccharide biosynthesis polyprenyl glycosylphosphotransferase